jgi:mRNA interferase RelE/StbE
MPKNQAVVTEIDGIVAFRYNALDVKEIVYTRSAVRSLRRIPANVSARIKAKIEQYAMDPASLGNNVTELKGRGGLRLRVGDWRVIMEDDVVLAVLRIGPRGDIYD